MPERDLGNLPTTLDSGRRRDLRALVGGRTSSEEAGRRHLCFLLRDADRGSASCP